MLTDARMFVERMPRAATVECTSYREACGDGRSAFLRLQPQNLEAIRRVPCDSAPPDPDRSCFEYLFRYSTETGGDWRMQIRGPKRPVHIRLWHEHPPVS